MNLTKTLLTLLTILPFSCFAQQTYLDFMNQSAPYFPGCEATGERYDCFVQSVGIIVADSVNSYHKVHPVTEDNVTIHITLGIKKTGDIESGSSHANTTALANVADAALKSLPKVIPAYSPEGEPTGTSVSVYLVLQKNQDTGMFSLVYEFSTEKWRARASPLPMKVVDAVFPGCDEKGTDLNQCFREKLADFVLEQVTADVKDVVMLRVTIDEKGKLYSHELFTTQATLKQEVTDALKSLPIIKPSTVAGKPYKATYMIPLNFN